MNASTLITMIVGLVIPALVVLVTKESMPPRVRALLTLFLTTTAGVLTGLASSPPSTLSQWEHVAVNIVLTWVAAAAAEVAGTHGGASSLHAWLDRRFGKHGVGPSPTPPPAA
jgi:hypothetical protein